MAGSALSRSRLSDSCSGSCLSCSIGLWRGWDDILVDIGILFSKAAIVTFGGAYAVLGYIGQQAVGYYGWLLPEQMMDGLGLAETTPGPLIMVNQFVAYVAAYTHAPGLAPALAGAIGGLLATWVTFTPSMLWIFIGAPYIEALRRNVKLASALVAITAAVVGVVLNLAVTFTRHTLLSGYRRLRMVRPRRLNRCVHRNDKAQMGHDPGDHRVRAGGADLENNTIRTKKRRS